MFCKDQNPVKTKQKITYMVFIVIDVCTTDWNDEWTLLFYNWIWIDSTHDRSGAMQQSLPAFPFLHLASVFPSLAFITHASGEQQLGCTVIVGARRGRHHQSPEYPGYIFQINYIPRMAGADAGPDTAVLASHFLSALPTHDDTCIFQVRELRMGGEQQTQPSCLNSQFINMIWFRAKAKPRVKGFIFCQFRFIRCMQDNTASTLFQIKIVSLRCMLECISNSAEENQAAQQNKSIILPILPNSPNANMPRRQELAARLVCLLSSLRGHMDSEHVRRVLSGVRKWTEAANRGHRLSAKKEVSEWVGRDRSSNKLTDLSAAESEYNSERSSI